MVQSGRMAAPLQTLAPQPISVLPLLDRGVLSVSAQAPTLTATPQPVLAPALPFLGLQPARVEAVPKKDVVPEQLAAVEFDGAYRRPKPTSKGHVVDDYFGAKVPDPYRWLENPRTKKTKAWVEDQNRASGEFLNGIPARERALSLLKELDKTIYRPLPVKQGDYYVFKRRVEGKEQQVLYKFPRKSPGRHGPPSVLLDPNEFAGDGTTALKDTSFSQNGKYMAYSLSSKGSDWTSWRIRDVETGADLPEVLEWTKFTSAVWRKDGSGFYYSRYERPPPGLEYVAKTGKSKLYFHALGTAQSEDKLVEAKPQPGWTANIEVIDNGHYALVTQTSKTHDRVVITIQDLTGAPAPGRMIFEGRGEEEFDVLSIRDGVVYARTDKDAPRGRFVAVDLQTGNWTELIAQSKTKAVLKKVVRLDEGFAAIWMVDARDELWIHGPTGQRLRQIPLPGKGTVDGLRFLGKEKGVLTFSSYMHPKTDFRIDFVSGRLRPYHKAVFPEVTKDMEVVQVFYRSKDGTRVPMTIIHKKGLKLDGKNPTYLYGYGGFNNSLTPEFSNTIASWVEMGGVYVVANLRGGGEYGNEWHDAGRLHNKQNVFDDFYAAAKWLIAHGYTSPDFLAAGGASNGGLLAAVALLQRPNLFAAAIPQVGVLDMLRFPHFTVGGGWIYNYGNPKLKAYFKTLFKYSPLHNVKSAKRYPATLLMTGDHDDRVVPSHSYKFAAALQAAQAAAAPILLRVAPGEGHSGNGSQSAKREAIAAMWAFLFRAFGLS